ncbi:hypothetical protein LSAT2_018946, partial [Lamellibrachia satsuma]
KYPGVSVDRSLTFRPHIENTRDKARSRVALVRKFSGSSNLRTLRTATIAHSARTTLLNPQTNDDLLDLLAQRLNYWDRGRLDDHPVFM